MFFVLLQHDDEPIKNWKLFVIFFNVGVEENVFCFSNKQMVDIYGYMYVFDCESQR